MAASAAGLIPVAALSTLSLLAAALPLPLLVVLAAAAVVWVALFMVKPFIKETAVVPYQYLAMGMPALENPYRTST
jgi:hypothetical protein